MEDANGGLFVPEGYMHIVGQKKKYSMTMNDEEWEVLDRKELETIQLFMALSMALNIET